MGPRVTTATWLALDTGSASRGTAASAWVLGIAGERRSRLLSDIPTLAEQGIANVNMSQWYAMFGPAKIKAE